MYRGFKTLVSKALTREASSACSINYNMRPFCVPNLMINASSRRINMSTLAAAFPLEDLSESKPPPPPTSPTSPVKEPSNQSDIQHHVIPPSKFISSLPVTGLITTAIHPYSLDGELLESNPENATTDQLFAVISFMGTQHKITLSDIMIADKMEGADIGDKVEMHEVLLIGSKGKTFIGRPVLPGCKVIATIEEKVKDKKVIIFKMRRRKNSKRKNGYRRQITVLRVTDIIVNDEF